MSMCLCVYVCIYIYALNPNRIYIYIYMYVKQHFYRFRRLVHSPGSAVEHRRAQSSGRCQEGEKAGERHPD